MPLGKWSFHPSIKYLGFIVDKDGYRPDPQKVTAATELPVLTEITTLRTFLGLVNYYQSFFPKMSSIRSPLFSAKMTTIGNGYLIANKHSTALMAFLILASSLTMTHRLKWLTLRTRLNVGWTVVRRFIEGHCLRFWFAEAVGSELLSDWEGKPRTNFHHTEIPQVYIQTPFHTCHKLSTFLSIFDNSIIIPFHSTKSLQLWEATLLGYDFKIDYRNGFWSGCTLLFHRTRHRTKIVFATARRVHGRADHLLSGDLR